jgi:hypothetical protein
VAKARETDLQSTEDNTDHQPKYVQGLRMDRMVNKQKANQGINNAGKSMPRRKVSSKPVKGCECKFRIHLKVLPGHYWRIAYTTEETAYHNHLMLEKEELRIPLSRLTTGEK